MLASPSPISTITRSCPLILANPDAANRRRSRVDQSSHSKSDMPNRNPIWLCPLEAAESCIISHFELAIVHDRRLPRKAPARIAIRRFEDRRAHGPAIDNRGYCRRRNRPRPSTGAIRLNRGSPTARSGRPRETSRRRQPAPVGGDSAGANDYLPAEFARSTAALGGREIMSHRSRLVLAAGAIRARLVAAEGRHVDGPGPVAMNGPGLRAAPLISSRRSGGAPCSGSCRASSGSSAAASDKSHRL